MATSEKEPYVQSDVGVDVEQSTFTHAQDGFMRGYGTWTFAAQAVVLPGSWAFAATALTIAIFGGGAPVAIWGTICIAVCLAIVMACLAEFGSAFPSAAGCTYIAYRLAGPEWGQFCVCIPPELLSRVRPDHHYRDI